MCCLFVCLFVCLLFVCLFVCLFVNTVATSVSIRNPGGPSINVHTIQYSNCLGHENRIADCPLTPAELVLFNGGLCSDSSRDLAGVICTGM